MLLLCVLLVSCAKEDDWISRRYPNRRFFFFKEEHPTSILFAAYTNPGTWVYAYCTGSGTKDFIHVFIESNAQKANQEEHIISSERERRAEYRMGASNTIGLIIGCTYFDGPRAYDRICPNCTLMMPLHWTNGNATHVTCDKCHREYDLDTGAIYSGDDGQALLRYGCSYDGNCLYVGN